MSITRLSAHTIRRGRVLFDGLCVVYFSQEVLPVNPAISIDPRICNGKPTIVGTRIPVTVILDQMSVVGSIDGILSLYPELTREQVVGALGYCHAVIDHTDIENMAV